MIEYDPEPPFDAGSLGKRRVPPTNGRWISTTTGPRARFLHKGRDLRLAYDPHAELDGVGVVGTGSTHVLLDGVIN
jgi:hypothetical protein